VGGSKNVLPSKFLLGGNINDPLNLNSLNDERIARVVNAVTPESSPLPTPKHRKEEYKIEVLIPPNISDPLNLNAEDDSDYEAKLISPVVRKKKVRHRKRPRKSLISVSLAQLPGPRPETEEGIEGDVSETEDEEGGVGGEESGAEGDEREDEEEEEEEDVGKEDKTVQVVAQPVKEENMASAEAEAEVERSSSCEKTTAAAEKAEGKRRKEELEVKKRKEMEIEGRKRKREQEEIVESKKKSGKKASSSFKEKNEKFQFGNYNQYYGYRNPGQIEDGRLQYLKSHWFEEKEVLDIGCNIGHITISIAKNHKPTRMVGIDIDKKLIEIAQKNVRFYRDTRPDAATQYPRCFPLTLGPLDPGNLGNEGETAPKFPNNIQFFAANYVLDCDELLETVTPEFDTIMCLSTTKWIHLNFGDEGLKRVFRRIYAQLRPGGTFILESQAFCTYRKKKKLTEKIFHNFKNIKLKPENFTDFLIHEVGFSRSEVLALPAHPAKGFQRPLQVFTKMPPSSNISASTTPYSFGISPHCYNPSFTPFYGKVTPGYTPRYSQTPAADVPSPSPAQLLPTPLYSGPTPPLYYGPTPGTFSANSTPCHSTPGYRSPEPPQPAGFTPRYTPSYTPGHPHYSPPHPSPDPPCYSPSAGYSPTPGYSPSAGYSPTPPGGAPALYSPSHAPSYPPARPPSLQNTEVSGNTTPHPGVSPHEARERPRYSWAGGSGGNTPKGDTPQGGNTPKEGGETPGYTPTYTPRGGDTPRAGDTPSNTPTYTPSNTPRGEGYTPNRCGDTPTGTPPGGSSTPSYTPTYTPGGADTPSYTPAYTPEGGDTPGYTPTYTPGSGETPSNTPSYAPDEGETPSLTPTYTPEGAGQTPSDTPSYAPEGEGAGTPAYAPAEGSTACQKPQDEATPSSTPTHTIEDQTPTNAPDSSHTTSKSGETPETQNNIHPTPEIIAASTKSPDGSTSPGGSPLLEKREESGRTEGVPEMPTAASGK